MANYLEFNLFKQYTVAVKQFLIKTLWLKEYSEENNVQAFFALPTRTFAKKIVPMLNGGNLNPTASFYLSKYDFNKNESPGGYFRKSVRIGSDKFQELRHPLPYTLTFRLTLWTNLHAEMDVLIWQLYNAASFNRPFATHIDGQWCQMYIGDPVKENDVEPGDQGDQSPLRYGVDITIPRAYLPLDYNEYTGIIGEINIGWDF